MFESNTSRPSSLVLIRLAAVSALGMAGMLVGCEKGSDPAVRTAVEAGAAAIQGGNSENAVTTLEAAKSDVVGATIVAKSTLGHAKLSVARTKAGQLDLVYVEIGRLQTEISNLTTAVSVGNTLVDGYKAADPNPARAKIKQRIAEAQGGADKTVWVDTGKQPLPTLSASKQNVSKLKEAVAAKQEEIKSLEEKRTAAVVAADKLAAEVDGLSGRASVDAFTKASGARKAITLVSGEIDVAKGELTVLESNLSMADGQMKVVEKYIGELQAQDKALASGYESVTGQISAQQAVSKNAVDATGEAAASATTKSEVLAAKMEEATKLFAEAETAYLGAVSAYDAASTEAASLRSELDKKKESYNGKNPYNEKMIATLQKAMWAAGYRTQAGIAQASLGDLYAAKAQVLHAQETLVAAAGPVFQKAGATVPATLKAEADGAKNAQAKALETYAASAATLEGAEGAIQGDPARERAAHLAHIFVLSSWAEQLRLSGDTAGAETKLKQASELASSIAQENNGKFPTNLPRGVVVTAAAPAPAN